MRNELESQTGKLPTWITYWPICIEKRRFDLRTGSDARHLLIRCHIDARINKWLWLFWRECWILVPRHQAARAESTLKRYGYQIKGYNLT